jgi:hypothetical protein
MRRPGLTVFLALAIGAGCILLGALAEKQQTHREGMRQAIGSWIRTDGLTSEQLEHAASSYDEWAWTDASGRFTAWPGHEDDASNEDDDACSAAWRSGYSVGTEDAP